MSLRQKTSKSFEDNQTMEAPEKETHFAPLALLGSFVFALTEFGK
jgi:hypothetical protein